MANDHRYLINEKASLFVQFMAELAIAYHKGYYDGRNEWACKCAAAMIETLIEKELWYNYEYEKALQSGDWSNVEL